MSRHRRASRRSVGSDPAREARDEARPRHPRIEVPRASRPRLARRVAIGALAVLAFLAAREAAAQTAPARDVCGCAGSASSFGAFDTLSPSTWPPGTVRIGSSCSGTLHVPLPPDGVMVFDSLQIRQVPDTGCNPRSAIVRFLADDGNAAATILVRGDATIESTGTIDVSGRAGVNGADGAGGAGGEGGPGGFAGGDGAHLASVLKSDGGAGIGPGGGAGGAAAPRGMSEGGRFFGAIELRPLAGGCGGGGGHSTDPAVGCAAGGGGGGGGALLLAVNGTLTVNGTVTANGGSGGVRRSQSCSSSGSGGSGGAIRLVASRITGAGSVLATGGAGGGCSGGADCGRDGAAGRIRLEAMSNDFVVNGSSPVALRTPAPGPLVSPLAPTVRITGVDGQATPPAPRGHRGAIDLVVDAPGPVRVDLSSSDVPEGTDLELTVKPKVGGAPLSQRVTLVPASCAGAACNVATTVDLQPGAYILEARATFEIP